MYPVSKYHVILSVSTFGTEDRFYNVFLFNYLSWVVIFLNLPPQHFQSDCLSLAVTLLQRQRLKNYKICVPHVYTSLHSDINI